MSACLRFQSSILILAGLSIGCDQSEQGSASQGEAASTRSPGIVVSSLPLLEMTRTIAGDAVDVTLVVPENISSRNWSPKAIDVRILQSARLILINGAGYEPWKDRISLPGSRLRDTAAGYYDQFIRIPDAVTHQHGPDGRHSHAGTVWATWLDPDLCVAQLHQVSLNCGRLIPDKRSGIEAAEAKFGAELKNLNSAIEQLKSISAAGEQQGFGVVSDSPNYLYLARRLGWTLRYLHWSRPETLSDADRTEFENAMKEHSGLGAGIFLMDSRRSAEAEAFVRDSGWIVVRIDLCETVSADSSPLAARMKGNLHRLLDGVTHLTDGKGNVTR